ncbi:diacylglycerol kinase family protein [Aestuariivirga sp.]|uniref:diacylglycerol kinase family protein n=1 Tax=Aestuariivirga sp. TaxID=2650926 RepID=UPI0035938CB8
MADAPRTSSLAGGIFARESTSAVQPAIPRWIGHHRVDRRPVTRAGLIVNPRAGKGSGKGLALAGKLQGDPTVTVRVLEHFEQLSSIIDDMAREEVSDLFISSGDGTIQEILTQIGERRPFRQAPRISLLPHGTTNLTAADLGFRRHSIEAQAQFMKRLAPADLRARHTIRCANPGDGKARHGMFVGTGAVATGTLFCQQAFNARGVKGQWATFGTLASAVAKAVFTAPDPHDQNRLDRAYDITVEANGRRYAEGHQLLQMSTTLDKLVLNTKPFWGGKTGPIRTSIFPYPVPSVLRWLLPVMYGSETRTPPPKSVSFCSDELRIASNVMFVIDGEFFDPPKDGPLKLEAGPVHTFVCG